LQYCSGKPQKQEKPANPAVQRDEACDGKLSAVEEVWSGAGQFQASLQAQAQRNFVNSDLL
jgi:hypothetical protein